MFVVADRVQLEAMYQMRCLRFAQLVAGNDATEVGYLSLQEEHTVRGGTTYPLV